MKTEPRVLTGDKAETLGTAQVGGFVFSRTREDGTTVKEVINGVTANAPLVPPKGAENAVLIGGIDVKERFEQDYRSRVVDGKTLWTAELRVYFDVTKLEPGTYGKGAEKPDSGLSPKA